MVFYFALNWRRDDGFDIRDSTGGESGQAAMAACVPKALCAQDNLIHYHRCPRNMLRLDHKDTRDTPRVFHCGHTFDCRAFVLVLAHLADLPWLFQAKRSI